MIWMMMRTCANTRIAIDDHHDEDTDDNNKGGDGVDGDCDFYDSDKDYDLRMWVFLSRKKPQNSALRTTIAKSTQRG